MTYRNKVTGAMLVTDCKVSGENWAAEVHAAPSPKKPAQRKAQVEKHEELRDD